MKGAIVSVDAGSTELFAARARRRAKMRAVLAAAVGVPDVDSIMLDPAYRRLLSRLSESVLESSSRRAGIIASITARHNLRNGRSEASFSSVASGGTYTVGVPGGNAARVNLARSVARHGVSR